MWQRWSVMSQDRWCNQTKIIKGSFDGMKAMFDRVSCGRTVQGIIESEFPISYRFRN